jgi:RimJ/RimL family protein N-acetyltransferase
MDNIIYGKKVVLFEFVPEDLEHFVKLHRGDKKGYLQKFCLKQMTKEEAEEYTRALVITRQIKCWSVWTKQGKASRRIGFIYLSDMTSFSAGITGIMDTEVAKGVTRKIREGKYTFSEDVLRTLIEYCFNKLGLLRLETDIVKNNKRALLIAKKAGFIQEGISRQSLKVDDRFFDVIQLSLLKQEYKNE